ncbi:MAG: flagellar M-ring protein FliF C-terminal domain-containing protein [Planctomycetota bacterium]
MNQAFGSLIEAFRGSSLASRVTAGLVAMAVLLAVGVSAVVSNRPHFSMLMSGLNDSESASAMRALAESGIAFEVSQPPGPFVVYVDEGDRSAALAAIYQSGAMIPLEKGIRADQSGMSSVFMSSGERTQVSQKRLWGEMEGILEALDFVTKARVQTSASDASPFASSAMPKKTCAAQLQVASAFPLTEEQADTVVLLISRGLEIEPHNIVVSDQSGNLLNDTAEEEEDEQSAEDWLEYKHRFDRSLSAKANAILGEILGPHKARVEIDSLWSFDQSTTSSETVSKGTVVSETKNATETPLGTPAAGTAGTMSNIDFGVTNAAVADASGDQATEATAEPMLSTTDEEKREFDPSRVLTETVSVAPTLKRMSIALFLDDSIPVDQVAALEGAVQAAVGYDTEERTDVFRTVSLPFALDVEEEPAGEGDGEATGEEGEASGEEQPAAETEEPSPMMELLLRRGVEIAVALIFIGLLLSSLRTAKKGAAPAQSAEGGDDAAEPEDIVDPELLAQAQVQELLTSNPERVGEILSQWARDESEVGAEQ